MIVKVCCISHLRAASEWDVRLLCTNCYRTALDYSTGAGGIISGIFGGGGPAAGQSSGLVASAHRPSDVIKDIGSFQLFLPSFVLYCVGKCIIMMSTSSWSKMLP